MNIRMLNLLATVPLLFSLLLLPTQAVSSEEELTVEQTCKVLYIVSEEVMRDRQNGKSIFDAMNGTADKVHRTIVRMAYEESLEFTEKAKERKVKVFAETVAIQCLEVMDGA